MAESKELTAEELWNGAYLEGAVVKSYPTSKVRGGSQEELPHIQGQEQWLRFAGAAVKRYPKSKVRETQVRR